MTLFKYLILTLALTISGNLFAQNFSSSSSLSFLPTNSSFQSEVNQQGYPDPKMVLRRSLIVPGWGQITNDQAWKIPIVYGLIGGLTYYSVYLTKEYHDYRAAYYNQYTGNTDLRFGPTRSDLVGANQNALLSNRNFLRNRRDFIYVTIGLAYLLNAVDAYVFAHLRSFDVSDDLSMNTSIKPDLITNNASLNVPGFSITFSLNKK